MLPVPIFTHGWRETMWGKFLVRKQHHGRDWAANHLPTEVQHADHFTTTLPRLDDIQPPHYNDHFFQPNISQLELLMWKPYYSDYIFYGLLGVALTRFNGSYCSQPQFNNPKCHQTELETSSSDQGLLYGLVLPCEDFCVKVGPLSLLPVTDIPQYSWHTTWAGGCL